MGTYKVKCAHGEGNEKPVPDERNRIEGNPLSKNPGRSSQSNRKMQLENFFTHLEKENAPAGGA